MSAVPASASPPRIKVMIVDDSLVIRGLVSRWLTETGAFDIVASAQNGRVALDMAAKTQPDIVLLDLDMPELDGLGTLPKLLALRPGIKVIVVSTLTRRNADISLKCLAMGAVDCLPKPESQGEALTAVGFRQELVSKLQALGKGSRPAPARPLPAAPVRPRSAAALPRVLLIGSSTGGPKAVGQVLTALGSSVKHLPVLIVQHMPPVFTSVFAEHLQAQSGVPAREPLHGEKLAPGQVYVAPGGRHMGLAKEGDAITIRLDDGLPVNFCRPAVDVLFSDAAKLYGPSTLSVVLTGMGSDGTNGAKSLTDAGGTVIVQDEATSTVWGMPGSIAKAGLANQILPLDAIAPAVKTLIAGTLK